MKIINGKEIAENVLKNISISEGKLGVILATDDQAAHTYVNLKSKKARKIGIKTEVWKSNDSVSTDEVIQKIEEWNQNNSVNGIMVQLPLYDHLEKEKILNSINHQKDVDGLTAIQQGKTSQLLADAIPPATVVSILEAINSTTNEDISWNAISSNTFDLENNFYAGKTISVINNSNLIGIPLANIFSKCNATVHILNKHTYDLKTYTSASDIVVSATGKTSFLDYTYFKEGATVIDVTSVKKGEKIEGDIITSKELQDKIEWITPVPGGIGPLTIACLLQSLSKIFHPL